MQWFFSGTWYDMSRTSDNYFVIQAILSQPLILPAQVKITSIFGDEVIDTVATSTFSVGLSSHHCFQASQHSAFQVAVASAFLHHGV